MNDHSFIEMKYEWLYAGLHIPLRWPSTIQGAGVNQAVKKTRAKRRTAPKEERQAQLIRATIRSIAKHGLSVTTMATVAKEARLSQGIINLHFQSKERLLEETLLHIVGEYREAWQTVESILPKIMDRCP